MLNNENRYLFKFAWKSIRRNAGRSFFIGFSVSLAVVIAVWTIAFFDGMNSQIQNAVVYTNTGFFQIQDGLYAKSTDSSEPVEWSPDFSEKLMQLPVTAASPELVLDANISTPEGAAALTVLGIDPKLHGTFMPIKDKVLPDGNFIDAHEEGGAVIGKELARIFKFKVGDQLVVNYQDAKGELCSEILSIKGIYNYNSNGFEKRFVYINQPTWQKLFFKENSGKILFNRVTMLTDGLETGPILQKFVDGSKLKLKSWKQLNPEMAVVLDFHDGMIRFFFLIIGVTITMTILTPVRMLWQERYKELKMMAIIGVSLKKFWKIGLFEVFLMTVLSGLFSMVLLVSVVGTQSYTGVNFRGLSDGVSIERAGIKLPGIIYPLLSANQIFITFVFVIFVLSFSYIWSIHRTLQKLEAEI
ncbi:MAG TPA: ABC transporter permease [Bacteriovoracaceae bacterium]|nr:ABC transporter permease [Bacteriovoracaceae bacterium]